MHKETHKTVNKEQEIVVQQTNYIRGYSNFITQLVSIMNNWRRFRPPQKYLSIKISLALLMATKDYLQIKIFENSIPDDTLNWVNPWSNSSQKRLT